MSYTLHSMVVDVVACVEWVQSQSTRGADKRSRSSAREAEVYNRRPLKEGGHVSLCRQYGRTRLASLLRSILVFGEADAAELDICLLLPETQMREITWTLK